MTSSGRVLFFSAEELCAEPEKPFTRRLRLAEPDLAEEICAEPEDDRIASITFVFCDFATTTIIPFCWSLFPVPAGNAGERVFRAFDASFPD